MKKIIALLTALALAMCLSVPAFAVSDDVDTTMDTITEIENDNTADHYVYANYVSESVDVYSVDIIWGDMIFTYTEDYAGTWNPETHELDDVKDAYWSADNDNSITVINHSNKAVDVKFAFEATEGTDIVGELTEDTVSLDSAVGTEVAEAPSETIYFNVVSGAIDSYQVIGEITATLYAA